MPERYLRVRNFEKFQHYNAKNLKQSPHPSWIKLYYALLRDRRFYRLPDAAKFHVMGFFLIASQYDNKIPFDLDWLQAEMNASDKIDLTLMLESKFIEWVEPWGPNTPSLKDITDDAKNDLKDITPLESRKSIFGLDQSRGEKSRGEKSREEEKEPLAIPSPEPKYPKEFDEFWMASTRRGSKVEAAAVWKKLRPDDALQCRIRAGMSAWQDSAQWQDETKQPHVYRWLKRRGWDEQVPRSPELTTHVHTAICKEPGGCRFAN